MKPIQFRDMEGHWRQSRLTEEEEKDVEDKVLTKHGLTFLRCLGEARKLNSIMEDGKKLSKDEVFKMAVSLFNKNANHVFHEKEFQAIRKVLDE